MILLAVVKGRVPGAVTGASAPADRLSPCTSAFNKTSCSASHMCMPLLSLIAACPNPAKLQTGIVKDMLFAVPHVGCARKSAFRLREYLLGRP
jgi:hypothetical protein